MAECRVAGDVGTHYAECALMHPGCQIDHVYLCRKPVDFRKSIDGLSVLIEQELSLSPFASTIYVFINRGHNRIKVLYWHRNGFCLWLKRLESEGFAWLDELDTSVQTLSLQEFEWLREGLNLWRNKPHKILLFTSVS
ncbi:MAG: IS66 family insertion sequence element accessory protein TnpB [Sheuella sp.]|nr:IS66 family insertion sequence element accessory protein TnpB [Sheuella sp.]